MRRQDKYPDTEIFHYLNTNPKNRVTTYDCVIRAISATLVARGKNKLTNDKLCKAMWECVMNDLSDWACARGYMTTDTNCYSQYLQCHGFKQHKQLRHPDNTKYTLKEFVATHPTGIWLVNMPTHLTVVIDGVNYDTWDCTRSYKKIGKFWEAID